MKYQEAESKLRAVARALLARDHDLKQRPTATFKLTFAPNGRVAVIWIVPLERESGEVRIDAMVDAWADRDREACVKAFPDSSSSDDVAAWVFHELCEKP